MFDSLAWSRECYEGYLLGLDDEDEPDDEEFWTAPTSELLPLPDGEAPSHSWTP